MDIRAARNIAHRRANTIFEYDGMNKYINVAFTRKSECNSVICLGFVNLLFLRTLCQNTEAHTFFLLTASRQFTQCVICLSQKDSCCQKKQITISLCRIPRYSSSFQTYFPSITHYFQSCPVKALDLHWPAGLSSGAPDPCREGLKKSAMQLTSSSNLIKFILLFF